MEPGAVWLTGTDSRAGVSGVLQVVSLGAMTWKRIEPVIVPTPPLRWATSWIGEPTVTGPEAVVLRTGVAGLICVELPPVPVVPVPSTDQVPATVAL